MKGPIKKILVYIDGTEQSITAAQYAIVLSRVVQAELFVMYVVDTRALSDLLRTRIFVESEQEEYRHDLDSDADRYLNHIKTLARQKGVAVETISTNGTVHQEIKKTIQDRDIDLLIIGELSRIRSRRDEFYNESERAMRSVPCPVLIVKDEDRVWDLFDSLV